MNPLIQQYEELLDSASITEEQEREFIDHIFNESDYTTAEEFAIKNISYYEALSIAQADDQFEADATEYIEGIDAIALPEASKLAYHLAYTNTEYGITLLNELLYYRDKGRL